MLSWVVKVVPQIPQPPEKAEEAKAEKPAPAPPPKPTPPPVAAPPPKPAPPPKAASPAPEKKVSFQIGTPKKVEKSKPEAPAAEGNDPASGSQGAGVLTWISGALPQPSRGNSISKEENTATSNPEDEKAPQKVIAWIAQGLEKVIPQPELKGKDQTAAEQPPEQPPEPEPEPPPPAPPAPEPPAPTSEASSDPDDKSDKSFPPRVMEWIKHGIEKVVPKPTDGTAEVRPSTAESETDAEQQPNMMGWIVNGFERMLPQPVQKDGDDVQSISIVRKKSGGLVLEDVEPAGETKKVKEDQQPLKVQAEDAGEQSTLQMDSIKMEAEEAERLQQERLEAARIAEAMARKAADEAVQQLDVVDVETLPETSEQLPNILEEENEDEQESLLDVSEAELAEDGAPSSREAEPVTQQPEPQAPEAPPTTDQEFETEGSPGLAE